MENLWLIPYSMGGVLLVFLAFLACEWLINAATRPRGEGARK